MSKLPTGTVTFLFTDIERSTQLLQELGDRYVTILEEHAAIVRDAIARGEGIEVGTEGDSFFVVFPTPEGAVEATVAAQRGIDGDELLSDCVVRVRMGLHTGQGVHGGDSYVGIDVNRAARIAAAAHGGQVLMSDATRGLVQYSLPDGTSLRDLGEHRLKDISHPERLFELVIEGLPCEFPPPRTLDARPNNLPSQLTSFVGREAEIAEVRSLLDRTRLLTLTGPGGTGKTRLALQVGAEVLPDFRDGAFFIDLSAVSDPALVPSTVAGALGIQEVAGRPILDVVKEHLSTKELVLIIDNFEQVVDAAREVEALLAAAPKLKVLVTSRVVASVPGEHEYEVPPLRPPDPEQIGDVDALLGVEAVRLFTERALAVNPKFAITKDNAADVAAITARLDGLPLAIELAATRTKILTPEQMLPRLEESLTILTSGPRTLPERQRTLRDAIAWSHDLLESPERNLFARLSVFTGGFTLAAAEAICDPEACGVEPLDGLTSLMDQSLIRRAESSNGSPRFSMLETIREFGQGQLRESGEVDALRRRHADHFLALVAEAEPHLTADDQVEWLDRLDRDHANIRAALRWAIQTDQAERAQEAAGALWRFWQQRGHLVEGRALLEEILAMPSAAGRTAARAKALIGAGGMAWWQRDRKSAGVAYEEALAIERELGDDARIAEALYNLSFVVAGEDIDAAADLLNESLELFRKAGHEAGVAQALGMLVIQDAQAGRWEPVIARLEETTGIWRRLGDRLHLAFDLLWLGFALGRLNRHDDARAAAIESLELFCAVDNPTGIAIALANLAFLATWRDRQEDAVRLAGASEALMQQIGGPPGGFAGILEGDPLTEARQRLPKDVFDEAWEAGLSMSLEDALALARESPG